MTGWEYASIANKGPVLRDRLNELGREGWELVAVTPRTVLTGPVAPAAWEELDLLYVFKRPLPLP